MSDVITVPSHTKKDNPKAALKPRPLRQRRDRVPTSSFPATVDTPDAPVTTTSPPRLTRAASFTASSAVSRSRP